MTTFLIIACIALLFIILFLITFAAAVGSELNDLEENIRNLTIEVQTVGKIATDARFEIESFRKHADGVWDVK